MAKKIAPWSIDTSVTKQAAISSIQEPKQPKPKSEPKPKAEAKPKKKAGRPKQLEAPTTKVLIFIDARDRLKKLAAMNSQTMTEFMSDLINKEAKNQGIK